MSSLYLGSAAIVDLDETLLFSCFNRPDKKDDGADNAKDADKIMYDKSRKMNDYSFGDIVGYKRPHVNEFLTFLHDRFDHLFVGRQIAMRLLDIVHRGTR